MAEQEKSMVIHAPVHKVYEVWANFEEFPKFMTHVKEIRVKSPVKSEWVVSIADMEFDFNTEITELQENKHIAWKSVSGINNSGSVDFEEVPEGTKLTIHLNYETGTMTEQLTNRLDMVTKQIEEDLNNFKTRVEKMAHAA